MINLLIMDLIMFSLGVAGFFLALFIYRKKSKKQPLICPMHSDCNAVVQSSYSRFMSLRVEMLGMLYFFTISIMHAVFILYPIFHIYIFWSMAALILPVIAFVFSLYLTSIQIFKLKQWCVWCVSSTIICAVIFVLAILNYPF